VSGQIISWLVTDINGVKYYFGNDNMVDLSNSTKFITLDQNASENTEAIGSHITSWYLVKIEDTNLIPLILLIKQSQCIKHIIKLENHI
jgi:hypothetical protein